MALKDWKRGPIEEFTDTPSYTNEKTNIHIEINETQLDSLPYSVRITELNSGFINNSYQEGFKTKAEAMRFARKYMREN